MTQQLTQQECNSLSWQDEQAISNFIADNSVEQVEELLLQEEQIECPVINTFGPGLYIRQVTIPAGTFAVGHRQTTEHMNLFLKGRMVVFDYNGNPKEISAPMMFTGPPGRKMGYALEDTVWLNIYSTTETDVAKLEDQFMEKSETWQNHYQQKAIEQDQYQGLLQELGISESYVRKETENAEDQVEMPYGSYKICVNKSPIQGKGVFATADITQGEIIGPARIGNKRTPIGRYVNHSDNPNAKMELFGNDIYMIALEDMKGYKGGELGTEITTNYRDNIFKSQEATKCQE